MDYSILGFLNTDIIGCTAVCPVNIFEVQEIAGKIVKGDNNA